MTSILQMYIKRNHWKVQHQQQVRKREREIIKFYLVQLIIVEQTLNKELESAILLFQLLNVCLSDCNFVSMCDCVCVCVCEREREGKRDSENKHFFQSFGNDKIIK